MDIIFWEKIKSFDLDEPLSEYGFTTRLANENYWTINFTQKAIEEYKKFMYLAATSDLMVSPSEIIDIVWHQHLIFTKSYSDFCDLLGKKVEHIPSTHNKEDFQKFKLAKDRTNKLYVNEFGVAPEEIWNYSDMYEPLELPKSKYKIRTFIIFGILVFLVLIVPAYFLLKNAYAEIDNPYFMIGYILLIALAFVALEMYNNARMLTLVENWRRHSFIFDLTASELICLKTTKVANAIHGIVNNLVEKDRISVGSDHKLSVAGSYGVFRHEELVILETIKPAGSIDYPSLLKQLLTKASFSNISNSMGAFEKYFKKSKPFSKIFVLNFIVLSAMLMLGFIRLVTGVLRDRPVTLLFILLVLYVIAIIIFLLRTISLMSQKIIPEFYKQHIIPEKNNESDFDWNYFLSGNAILASVFVPMVISTERRYGNGDSSASWSSSDSSSGSDSSGCGSSCSSCGGCGGD